jgi:hypothetical protein
MIMFSWAVKKIDFCTFPLFARRPLKTEAMHSIAIAANLNDKDHGHIIPERSITGRLNIMNMLKQVLFNALLP